ncbi:hypothetical protein TSUD_23600 [Trifolium subterraneum]|uniref:FBD domain-containing protein n=1 Tax=Trifolium subterraneum TaxID=3900 RepID=A0A2Z6M2D2_TRISU|nr:hypothetical protein TSUD_23600 [Trifolium subterraneum]
MQHFMLSHFQMPVFGGIGVGDGSVYYPISLFCLSFIPHCPGFDYIKDLARMKHCLANIPAFGMLRHLQLLLVASEILFSLLLKSPCLQTLVIEVKRSDEEPPNFAIIPDCFLSTLKEVKFEYFSGGKHELSFAKFVMEKGQVLQSIGFSCSEKLHREEFEKLKEEIFLVKRNFTIEFSAYSDKEAI